MGRPKGRPSTNEDRTPLAQLRANAGYTLQEAAVLLQLAFTSLSKYERGERDMTFGVGEAMAELYRVPFEIIRQAVLATKKLTGGKTKGRLNPVGQKKIIAEVKNNAE